MRATFYYVKPNMFWIYHLKFFNSELVPSNGFYGFLKGTLSEQHQLSNGRKEYMA